MFISKSQIINSCSTAESDTLENEQLPWFGNNQYLRTFLDSIGYYGNTSNRIIGTNQVVYHIPVKFWVHRNSNGTGGPTEVQLQRLMDNLNNFYNVQNRTLMGFYMKCQIDYINDDNTMNLSDAQARAEGVQMKEEGCVNVHIANAVSNAPPGTITLGVFYKAAPDAVFIAQQAYGVNFPDVLSHEIGHLFGLLHTHEHENTGRCRKEAIDRNRTWPTFNLCFRRLRSNRICEATGDCLDDTPADPNLINNNSCAYVLPAQTDPWGDNYNAPPAGSQQPDTRFIMSYNQNQTCINRFSNLQIGVMLHSIERGRFSNLRNSWVTRSTYDEYEPDNTPNMARPILLGQIQERNFHQQFNLSQWTMCDVDWVSYTANCSGTYALQTSYQPGGTILPDTRLTLFAANGTTQLAQNDDKSATDKFSLMSYPFVAGTTYLIRIENLNPVMVSYNNFYYNLSIGGASVLGADNLCRSQSYTLDIPNTSNVVWTIAPSPNNFVSINNPNANPVTLSQISGRSGNVTLTATFNALPCINNGTASKTIHVGLNAPVFSIYAPNGTCQGQSYEAIGSSIGNGTVTYNWYINGVLNSYHGYKIRDVFPTNNTRIELEVVSSSCGISEKVKQDFTCTTSRFALSPNPSRTSVLIDTKNTVSFSEIRIIDKFGNIKKQVKVPSDTKTYTLDISNLSTDIYTVLVFDGVSWTGKTLSVF